MTGAGSAREGLAALARSAGRLVLVYSLGLVCRLKDGRVSLLHWTPLAFSGHLLRASDGLESFLCPVSGPCEASVKDFESNSGGSVAPHLVLGACRVLTVPVQSAAGPSILWIARARHDPLAAEHVQELQRLTEQAATMFDRPESPDAELTRQNRHSC